MWYPFKRKIHDTMTTKVIGSIIRQLLTLFGAGGILQGDDIEQLAGALSIIISLVWSIIEKRNRP